MFKCIAQFRFVNHCYFTVYQNFALRTLPSFICGDLLSLNGAEGVRASPHHPMVMRFHFDIAYKVTKARTALTGGKEKGEGGQATF